VSIVESLIAAGAAVAASMFLTWTVSLIVKDASIVDIVWGLGFVLVAWTVTLGLEDRSARAVLLVALTTVWGLRLTGYLAWRNLGEPEDRRYRAMRKKHGDRFPLVSLVTVFALQAVIMWVVSLPVQAGQHGTRPLGLLDLLGAAVFAFGLLFESVGDLQLARFKANPANGGEVLDTGLWRYTRHPNYFGDFCVWWGLYLIALAGGAWWTMIGPAVMSLFLMRISGVGMLEKTIGRRRPGYADYIERTNTFFPGPPRREGRA